MGGSRLGRLAATGALVVGATVTVAGPVHAQASGGPHLCSGTMASPGVLAGSYRDVEVSGFCAVNAGRAEVHGSLTVLRQGALAALFALNDRTGTGSSSLTVDGNVTVDNGGVALLGCFPTSFPCLDDPNPNSPTLASHVRIRGNLIGDDPLGIIAHDSRIDGDVYQEGGGGGFNCAPHGAFKAFQSPAYSDYEDSSVGGNLTIKNLTSCWLGVARVHIRGNATFTNNQLADPDAIEIIANDIDRNLSCTGNSMVWDSADAGNDLFPRILERNQVAGERSGQCVLASPRKPGGELGPGKF